MKKAAETEKYRGKPADASIDKRLLSAYNPAQTEERIWKFWEESGYFSPDNLPGKRTKPFTIMLPPPNVTGVLHMGHALNAVIQDILIRKKRMEGYKTLWVPGTDHAGIATQNVVEKQLKKQGVTRHDLGREKFLEKVWEWKNEYGDKILAQLKRMGASCDWSRTRFTMDLEYARAVEEAFLRYQKRGLIYQGERVVNWCPRCQTSLSDLELEYEDTQGILWYIRYPLAEGSGHVTVATTRPETMLGDTAVAVNPGDPRYQKFVGKRLKLPIVGDEIPIIADAEIDKEFGTGAVKVTPGHSIVDAEIGERNSLPIKKVIGKFGKMEQAAGEEFSGLKVADARTKVVELLRREGMIEKEEPHLHRVAKCYRCNSVIEPQPSLQWFVKMNDPHHSLAQKAIDAVKTGKVRFNDPRWEKIYLDWLSRIKDWCISRQIWWGHKIPLEGETDVLDTWFSSALWPFATLGWPDEGARDLKIYYPTQVLSTARDIINLWVTRMIFSAEEFTGTAPFSDVIVHPTVLAKDGRRMSKSLGTGVDPLELIERYGTDATRFGLIYQMMGGQDMRFDEAPLAAGKKFANKLWNMARFVLTSTHGSLTNIPPEGLSGKEREIVRECETLAVAVSSEIDAYRFGHALHLAYDFAWHRFADDFIEYSKGSTAPETKAALSYVFLRLLVLLHPFMPFITEQIWNILFKGEYVLMIEPWNRNLP